MKKAKILIVYPGRFGFHVVSYFLGKYASLKHDVTYLGLSFRATNNCSRSNQLPGVRVREHECRSGLFGRAEVLRIIKEEVSSEKYDLVFTAYIPGISLLRRFFSKRHVKVVVDIRSGFLVKSDFKRRILNGILRYECRKFTNRTINSELLGEYLGFSKGDVFELPLGAEPVNTPKKASDKLHLLYVGALSKRNVDVTVAGLKLFMDRMGSDLVQKYDIIGAGSPDDEQSLRDAISAHGLEKIIEMHGYVPRENIQKFLSVANVGVSFVPMTPYYDMQPVTKTYEFLLAGLPLIATRTTQNLKQVNAANGVLIDDTAESFSKGLEEFVAINSVGGFDCDQIRESSLKHSWEKLISEQYLPYLEAVFDS